MEANSEKPSSSDLREFTSGRNARFSVGIRASQNVTARRLPIYQGQRVIVKRDLPLSGAVGCWTVRGHRPSLPVSASCRLALACAAAPSAFAAPLWTWWGMSPSRRSPLLGFLSWDKPGLFFWSLCLRRSSPSTTVCCTCKRSA